MEGSIPSPGTQQHTPRERRHTVNYTPRTVTTYSNYRIEVAPPEPWLHSHKTPEEKHKSMMRELENLNSAAWRHLDSHDGISSHYDREVSCQFCGENWDFATDDDGVPCCCTEAMCDYEAQTGLTVQ